jgi:hypothetical protein
MMVISRARSARQWIQMLDYCRFVAVWEGERRRLARCTISALTVPLTLDQRHSTRPSGLL